MRGRHGERLGREGGRGRRAQRVLGNGDGRRGRGQDRVDREREEG